MTRKEALLKAIEILEKSKEEEKEDVIKGLKLCVSELPFTKWSEEAIFDACDQYCKDHNRTYLILADFTNAGLPAHPTIKNRFGITAREFRDKYYPIPKSSFYHKKTNEEYTKDFIEQFKLINPSSAVKYNKCRPKGYPTWQHIAKINDLTAWLPLLSKFGLQYQKPKHKYRVKVHCPEGGEMWCYKKWFGISTDYEVEF